MGYEDFWFGNPQHYFVYQNAYYDKKKLEYDEADIIAWNGGRYNLLAFQQVYSDCWSKSHSKIFPEKPYGITNAKEKEKEKINPRDRFIEIMSSFNSRRRK